MTNAVANTVDDEVANLLAANDVDGAVEVVLSAHGTAIYGMLMGVFHDEAAAQDVFQHFSIELWKSLPSFQARSSVYTWAYVIARRAITHRLRKRAGAREQRLHTEKREALVAANWSRRVTAEWQRTETKTRFREICEDLPHDERLLVMLRIGEKMSWKQIAQVLHEGEEQAIEGDALTREAASLRKRFERVKAKLRDALTDFGSG